MNLFKNFPKDIPVAISYNVEYKKHWKGWDDFLGKKRNPKLM